MSTLAYMSTLDEMRKMAEMASGYRIILTSQGFSPAIAEAIAAQWLISFQSAALARAAKL